MKKEDLLNAQIGILKKELEESKNENDRLKRKVKKLVEVEQMNLRTPVSVLVINKIVGAGFIFVAVLFSIDGLIKFKGINLFKGLSISSDGGSSGFSLESIGIDGFFILIFTVLGVLIITGLMSLVIRFLRYMLVKLRKKYIGNGDTK